MTIAAGTRLGRYEIRSKIGAGGMGEVYLAEDTRLHRKVALKILPAEVAGHPDWMKRFVQEAKSASALNHPNIITIHEIDQADSVNFIAIEFVDGETLRERMRKAPVKLGEVLDVAIQTAGALSAAHAAGIVHRDIKPENIMFRRDGIVKVLDFGLAKLTERSPPDSVDTEAPTRAVVNTDPGMVMGTAIYMSPEQARGLQVDTRTDIFSLGVLIYEMIAGRLPFEGSNTNEILASILSDKEPSPLARYSREVPAELERIVSKALRKNRDERYQTIKDLLLDLQSLKQELEFEKKLERSAPPQSQSAADVGEQGEVETVMELAARPTVSVRGLTSAIKLNQRSAVIAVAALLIIASAAGAYVYFTRARNGPINSVAVLPFVNGSGNSDTEYLSDGITESIISSLSQLPQLRVMARSTVFRYKGKDVDPQKVGNDLGVGAVLMGRVIQQGDNLTIRTELVNVSDGTELWGHQYNRKLSDALVIQEEIAKEISDNLRLKLSSAERGRVTKHYTDNPEAYQLYLKGRFYWNKRADEAVKKSIEYFNQAIAKDPNYTLAYTGLADSYSLLGASFDVGPLSPSEAIPKAKGAAMKALEMDDTLAEAHTSLAFIRLNYDWDWAGAEREFKRAIELNPNYDNAHHWYSHYLMAMGRTEESLAESKGALELDQLGLIMNVHLGWHYLHAHQYDLAIAQFHKTLEMDPNYGLTHWYLGQAYEQKAMYVEAETELRKAKDLLKENVGVEADIGHTYAISGKRAEAKKVIDELERLSKQRYVSSYHMALIYAGLGEKDQAFDWLENAYQERSDLLVYLKVDPRLDSLRSDPRFAELVRRVGLPQ